MRYAVLIAGTLISALFGGAIFPAAPIFSVQPDIGLVFMITMIFIEKTMTPVFYFSACGFILDIFFSRALGFYTLPYLIIGLVAYRFIQERQAGLIGTAVVGMLAWVVKELLGVAFCWLTDSSVDVASKYFTSILPGIPIAGILTLLAYLLMQRLYRSTFMWPAGHKAEHKNMVL